LNNKWVYSSAFLNPITTLVSGQLGFPLSRKWISEALRLAAEGDAGKRAVLARFREPVVSAAKEEIRHAAIVTYNAVRRRIETQVNVIDHYQAVT
jgi:hypothetical protein